MRFLQKKVVLRSKNFIFFLSYYSLKIYIFTIIYDLTKIFTDFSR